MIVCRSVAEAFITELVHRVRSAVGEPIGADSRVRVRISVGVGTTRPGDDGAAVLRRADASMYDDKRRSGS